MLGTVQKEAGELEQLGRAAMSKTGRSHLLRHTLPEIDVAEHFGTTDGKEIAKEIARMGQKELQAKFKAVYGAPTFSNNNNWLRRKLMEAAGLQTPKVLGTGQTSPRKHSHNLGDPGIDGGAFERLQGGIRRTKRQRKPKQYEDMMLGEGMDGDFMHSKAGQRNSDRAPLSIGDAYLQHQNAAYQASLGWQDTGDFLISPHMLGKHQYGGMGGAFGLPGLSEVVWPGVQKRSLRDNESGSSSEDQTAYEGGHHSHYSHSTHSHEGPARSPRAADKLVREIQEAIALLGGAAGGAPSSAAAAGSFHGGHGGGRSGLADLGFPTFEPHDLAVPGGGAAAHLWNFGSAERAGEPRSIYPMTGGPRGASGGEPPSPPLNLQAFLRFSGMGEHVGGNTPILEDFSYPLVSSPALLGGLGADAMELPQRLSSLETPGGSRERRSPSLGADLAALFPTLGSLEGRQLISQLGSGPATSDRDTPQPSAASSLDRILSDLGSSDVLQEHKIASVPTAPAKLPRGHANMEGAAAPSMRFAGVPLPPISTVAPPRFQSAAPPKEAGAEPLPSQAPAPNLAPSETMPKQESASRLTSVASLASWSRAQLQEQAAATAEAAGTADDPVVLQEGPNTADCPAVPSEVAGPAAEASQCPEGPVLGQQCGAVEVSRQGASGVLNQGEQRVAEVPAPEAPGSEKGKEEAPSLPKPVSPFTFLQ